MKFLNQISRTGVVGAALVMCWFFAILGAFAEGFAPEPFLATSLILSAMLPTDT